MDPIPLDLENISPSTLSATIKSYFDFFQPIKEELFNHSVSCDISTECNGYKMSIAMNLDDINDYSLNIHHGDCGNDEFVQILKDDASICALHNALIDGTVPLWNVDLCDANFHEIKIKFPFIRDIFHMDEPLKICPIYKFGM
jgi:hypothetical protein